MPARSIKPLPADSNAPFDARSLDKVGRLVRAVALWGGGGMLVALVALTVLDVGLRYLFNAPLYGARDVAKLMLLVMVASSLAYSARSGGQVAIEFFSERLGPRVSRWREAGLRMLATVMLLVLSWRLWSSGREAARFGEASLALGIPARPFYGLLALGMLLYAAVLLAEIPLAFAGKASDRDFFQS